MLVVALRCQKYYVVGSVQYVEGVELADFLETYAEYSVFHACHEPQALLLGRQFLAPLLELPVEGRQFLPEFFNTAVEEVRRDEEIGFDILLIDLVACFSAKDYEFAYYILSGKVDARVRLPKSGLLCQSYGFAERNVLGKGVENENKIRNSKRN